MGQFFRRLIGCFGLSSPPTLQNITEVVRILPSPPAWIGVRLAHAKPQYFADPARLEKRLNLGSSTRNATPQAPCTELHVLTGPSTEEPFSQTL
jgi:hypothetical protein